MADAEPLLARLSEREFDMIVVGGGITGCGIAREATLRGLRVALVEQQDFGSGTSSRSSRLIHGGVRYLEHGHFRLVFEASAERHRLLRLAPHLVRPLEFTWPVYAGARVPRWKLAAGLTLYDALALFRNVGRHRRLSALEVHEEQPALKTEGLVGGATYYDATTDDARLTLAVALDAAERGAVMLNHTKAIRLILKGGAARGIEVRNELTAATTSLRGAVIVNATGPWSDDFRRLESASGKARIQGSKGVHIAVPRGRLPNRGALTLLSPIDGRVMFVLPGGTHTIIGTTDTFTNASPDDIRATVTDVGYLLAAANTFFPDAALTYEDVVSAWAGIRPLAPSSTNDSVAASREHAIEVTPAGVVAITGGKLTTFRVMAAQTVDVALKTIGQSARPSGSETAPLKWNPSDSVAEVMRRASRTIGDEPLATHLVTSYGSAWMQAWSAIIATNDGPRRIDADLPYRLGEMRHACGNELARTFSDLLVRRTHIAFETQDHGRIAARAIARYVAPLLGWTPLQVATELDRYDREVERMFTIDED